MCIRYSSKGPFLNYRLKERFFSRAAKRNKIAVIFREFYLSLAAELRSAGSDKTCTGELYEWVYSTSIILPTYHYNHVPKQRSVYVTEALQVKTYKKGMIARDYSVFDSRVR
jgi:hypothetical protein